MSPSLAAARIAMTLAALFAFDASADDATPAVTKPVRTMPLPGVKGRIDHFAADPARHRLFVAALGNNTVEVIDTQGGEHVSVRGFGEPQGIAYVPEANRLYVANGGAGRVDVLDASSLKVVQRIVDLDDADNVRYDPATRSVIVGYGRGALAILDASTGRLTARIALPGHPESFRLERDGPRVFVNVPSSGSVIVVDRAKRRVLASWRLSGAGDNFPMALDEAGHRLFVGTRSPALLLAYDTRTGGEVARVPIGGDADDVFFDAARNRVYVICGAGRIDVIGREGEGGYAVLERIATAARARTGLFVPEESMLYVAAPANGATPARVLVFPLR